MHCTRLAFASLMLFAGSATLQADLLINTNSVWRFRPGQSEASSPVAAWRALAFNDTAAGFTNASSPFWYGDPYTGGTVLSTMLNGYTCIFLRQTFVVTNLANISALRFGAIVDDGFVVWINGTEVTRLNVADASPTIATLAANASEPAPFVEYDLPAPGTYLVPGTNIIAIQGFNTTLSSSDFGFNCSLSSVTAETIPPTVVSFSPPAGTLTNLTQITVQFSEPITGLSADDLNVHGIGATGLSGSGDTYTFTFPPAPYGVVPISWVSGHGITDLAVPPNRFNETGPGATWSYTIVDLVPPAVASLLPPAGATLRTFGQLQVNFSENIGGVNAADLLVNNQPATNLIVQPNAVYIFQFAQPPNGPVSVTFAPGHGITDLAAVPNTFPGGAWTYTVNPNATLDGVIINEFNAANENGLRDEDSEEQDWIELFNASTSAIDLAGWSLSDDEEEPGRWIFPSRLLAPGQYLVVFASAKDRRSPTGTNRFHTSFKLGVDGEFLGLFTPDSPRRLASGFPPKFPVQRNNYSYGRDANGQPRYFATPTPGASNGVSAVTGIVAPVHFSASRGHFTQPFDLVLSCPTPGASIRYTTNGSEPTALNGFGYHTALRITNTATLRAVALRTNLLSSSVVSHSYFFNQSAAIRSLPIISILTASNNMIGPSGIIGMNGGNLNNGSGPPANPWAPSSPPVPGEYHNTTSNGIAWERPMSAEYIMPSDNSGFQIDCGMRVQGSDYTRPRYAPTDKISYRLYFRGDYSSSRLNYPFFADAVVQSFDQIVLRAGHNDISNPFLRDELARQLHADMGQVAVHGTWVNFFINGASKGYYNPTERVEEGFLQSWHGGSNSWDIITVGSAVQGGDNVAWNAMRNYVSSQNVLLPDVYTEITRRLDVTNFIDYLLVNVYGATWDWPHNNWRAARERAPGGIWRFYVWDAEGAFGGFDGSIPTSDPFIARGINPAGVSSPLLNGTAEIPVLYTRLRNSPEFRLLWADRVQKHFFNNGALMDTNVASRFIQMRSELVSVIPTLSSTILAEWIPNRRAPLMNQFGTYGLRATTNAPFFNQHGGTVPTGFALTMSITNGPGTIYYTTNGDDPRVMFSGAVSNSAVVYANALTLNQSTLIKARTLSGTDWSALTEANFAVATRGVPLRITEINYNSATSTAHEFIELQNLGTTAVDLTGMNFEGVSYTFPTPSVLAAGARLVLASDFDPTAFAARYPGVAVRGYYSGSLNNGGERIVLKDAAGNVITSLDYSDGGGWPVAADGGGSSLEIINPFGDPDDPANWRASSVAGGTPGLGSSTLALGNVRLNEIMAENFSVVSNGATFPDWVELFNAGSVAADIAGWSLSDDGNARKFVFPAGTSISAGGYLVVWCDAGTNTTPGLHTGLSLDRDADSLFLYDANTNRVDAVSFGYQLADMTMGRVAGEWRLNQPTPNAANVPGNTADATNLVINEWLANPPSGQNDWIELFNRSTSPVSLRGLYVGTSNATEQITSLAFVPASGFVQLFCDEGVGWNHLDFRLPAAAGAITLADSVGVEFDRVTYTAQTEGVTRGRLPNGGTTFTNFVGTASPGASNYVISYTGPVINEVLARNQTITNGSRVADFVELFNGGAVAFNLGGMSLSVDSPPAGQWIFPPNTSLAPNSYLVIWCDASRPASTNAGDFNTGRSLDGDSGGAYLFAPSGQVVNSVVYGFQIPDKSIAVIGGSWQLATAPTPGAANSTAATLGSALALRINEWMANPASGPDWFELFNPGSAPVNLDGLILTDDPSLAGATNSTRIAPLSFIDAAGFVKWIADGQLDQGRNHVSFSLDAQGENLRLYQSNGTTTIDTVAFGTQSIGVSAGRLPDGADIFATFAVSPTPAESNYQLVPGVVISEVLARSASPLEDAVEIQNRNSSSVAIGGWYLSDDQRNFKKFRIANGANIGANSFVVFYEAQFNGGASNRFTLDGARGDEVWLSAADPAGNLTGLRAGAKFSPASSGVSIGRIETSTGVDYSALSAPTFGSDAPASVTQFRTGLGALNAAPRVGPVVINEIMYHPTNAAGDEEFIELLNTTAAPVSLFDSTNTWQLSDAVSFRFLPNTTLAANGSLLVVGFDPANAALLNAFRARHSISPSVPIFGPWTGNLDNESDDIELLRPDASEGGFIPYVRVDRVNYADAPPWASGAVDGGGLSLQRRGSNLYGNEAENWLADAPTPGRANGAGIVPLPVITQSPADRLAFEGTTTVLTVAATGGTPLGYQWRFNGFAVPDATNASLVFDFASLDGAGQYDVVVSNPGGVAVSDPARLMVAVPPGIVTAPVSAAVTPTNRVQFSVVVRGSDPIAYQWRLNGVPLPGETGTTLIRDSVQLPDDGVYSVTASNAFGTATASATLTVLVRPVFTVNPLSQSVVAGGDVTLSASATGNPLPFTWRFLRNGAGVGTNTLNSKDFFFTVTNLPVGSVIYRVAVTNLAGSAASANATITVLADTDGDGLPDEWETDYGLDPNNRNDRDGDADNDGVSNLQEYRAGTDPKNVASFLKIDSLSLTDGTSLRFGSISNKTYTVQYTDRLGLGAWQRLADVLAQSSNSVQVITDPVAATNRFYRLVTPRQP